MADNNDDVGSDGLVNLTDRYIARRKRIAQRSMLGNLDNNDDVESDGLVNLTKQYITQKKELAQKSMDNLPGKFLAATDPITMMSFSALVSAATIGSMFLIMRRARNLVRDNNIFSYWSVHRQQNQEAMKHGKIMSSQTIPLITRRPDFDWVPCITRYVMQERPDDTISRAKKLELVGAMEKYVEEQRRKSEGQSPYGDVWKAERSQF